MKTVADIKQHLAPAQLYQWPIYKRSKISCQIKRTKQLQKEKI